MSLIIGVFASRHLGRECRDPVAMDGNVNFWQWFFEYIKYILGVVFHVLVFWIPAIHAGMTTTEQV